MSFPTLLWGWVVDQLPLSIIALPSTVSMALSTIQMDPIYCIHLPVYYLSLPQGNTWQGKHHEDRDLLGVPVPSIAPSTMPSNAHQMLIGLMNGKTGGMAVRGVCVVGAGALLGDGIDKALYQARLPK